MRRHRALLRRGQLGLVILLSASLFAGRPAAGDQVILKDGRVLEGRFDRIEGVAVNPLNAAVQAAGNSKPIVMCDNRLTRTMVPFPLIKDVPKGAALPKQEKFDVPQQVADNGAPVASIGPILEVTPWDKFGRRTFSMATNRGRVDVIQGLTTITPLWSSAQSLRGGQNYLWDMRIATSSIPRDVLSAILLRQIDPKDPDKRLKLVRFYMQADRFQDAEAELRQVIAAFPNLQGLSDEAKALHQLAAARILSEVEVRRHAAQHHLAYSMLDKFPTQDVAGPVLQQVRDKLDEYRKITERGEGVVNQMKALLPDVKNAGVRKQLQPLCDEMAVELRIGTLDRMAPFIRLADDKELLPEQKLALAVSGWLLGGDDAVDNVEVAMSLAEARNLIRSYLNEPVRAKREPFLSAFGSTGISPKLAAALLAHMKPPLDTPPQEREGFFKLEVPGIENEPDVVYYVQLPPEYDPYTKYPTIVTLHGARTNPADQIDWWAGVPKEPPKADADKKPDDAKPDNAEAGDKKPGDKQPAAIPPQPAAAPPQPVAGGMRLGQATRQGYIVIAPIWTKPHQDHYEYTAREHAAVLHSLRDAERRFSIDTDRVFLSGHSEGGDAAWDIALAHPDLWAGVIPVVATSGKIVQLYWRNAAKLSLYFISGELDGNRTVVNSQDWDRYFSQHQGWDMTLVEYQGRGHEHFSDEILRIFDWMGRKRRDFFPHDFNAVTMRSWDNFFWCVELKEMRSDQLVEPEAGSIPKGAKPMQLAAKVNAANGINVEMHAAKVIVWLSPESGISFERPITITVNGDRIVPSNGIKPSVGVILEDARTRGDRQHPFWAKVEQ